MFSLELFLPFLELVDGRVESVVGLWESTAHASIRLRADRLIFTKNGISVG